MFDKENEKKKELEQIWDGLSYHVNELAKFMNENEKESFFGNEENEKKMRKYAEGIICAYYLGMRIITRSKVSDLMSMILGGMESTEETKKPEEGKETKKPEEGETTFSMEDMLKSVFGMTEDKKEDTEP